MDMMDKISLAGDLGSGKSTVSKLLIDRMGAEYYSTGRIVRAIAERMGMDVNTFNTYMETHPETDNEIDDGLRALKDDPRFLIIDSRMAWRFTPGTFKVYMSTDSEVSALRIMNAHRDGESFSSLGEAVSSVLARRASERKRYYEMYGVDIKDLTNYDFVIDTTYLTPDEVAGMIEKAFRLWQMDKSYRACYLSFKRLNISDREIDSGKMLAISDIFAEDCDREPLSVYEKNGAFYLKSSDNELLMAYCMEEDGLLPCNLLSGEPDAEEYVRMENSL